LNTIYFNSENKEDLDDCQAQLDWIEKQLKSAEPGRKFIFTMHIYPGVYHFMGTNE
jgi:hypothetical protein